jgi:hypothetical protein
MPIEDQAIHNVDVVKVDDSTTGLRLGVKQVPTTLYSNVPCQITDIRSVRVQRFDREQMETSHVVKFPSPILLDTTHRLIVRNPTDGLPRAFSVNGFTRPQSEHLPWVAFCQEEAT